MLNISSVTFIIIIQIIIMLTALSGVLFFLLRAKNKEMLKAVKVRAEKSPLASVEFYLTAEIKLLEGRFAALYKEDDLLKETFAEADWLSLRKNFLVIERELLTEQGRLEELWNDIGDKFKNTLKEHNLVKRRKVKDINEEDEEDVKEMKTLLKTQYDEFDSLYLELDGAKSEAEVSELKEKLSSIIRSHTELTHCIYILEDENTFLHNQIKELTSNN